MMKALLFVVLCTAPFSIAAVQGVDEAARRLTQMTEFNAGVKATVELPVGSDDEIIYNLKISTTAASDADTLQTVAYLVDWELPKVNSHGFSAYFDGNFYRYRDGSRMQEYHAAVNPEPFTSAIPVQTHTQFYETLPVALGAELLEMTVDTTFTLHWVPDTVFRGADVSVLLANRNIRGYEAANLKYVFDRNTMRPLYIEKEMSPGSISEQTLTYVYSYSPEPYEVPLSESTLSTLYPEAFSLYRDDNFGLLSLKDKAVPPISLPTLDGERFNRSRGETTGSLQLIVFLDENIGSTPDVIANVRRAIGTLPMSVDVVWIFLSNRSDDIETLTGNANWGETVLKSGRNAVKDFGVAVTPSLIFVGRDGKVKDVVAGFNNNLYQSVIDIVSGL